MDVTLIVKASNQQCEDLTIKCEPSWTIRRLKGHLTEVYPGKPSTDEQKLIYSGQLLGDSVVLKDVLRQYDGQQAHTVHLVFTPKNSYYGGSSSSSGSKPNGSSKMASTGGASSASNGSISNSGASGSANGTNIMGNNLTGTGASTFGRSSRENANDSAETTVDGGNGDGLRHRSVPQARPHTAPRTTPRPSQFVEQTAALQNFMQQAYMQYLNQYINVINEQTNAANALYSASGLPMPTGASETATPAANPLSGAQAFPNVPFVPVVQQASAISGGAFPNLAYYPCMTSAPYTGGLPSASNIPTPITSTTTNAAAAAATGPAGALPSALLPPSASNSPAGSSSSTPSIPAAGTLVDSSSAGGSGSTTIQAGSEAATAVAQPGAAEQGADVAAAAAGQDVAAGQGAAVAPARARRFPNIVVEEQENNDWLDVFFSMCRVGILITVIYLYSSPMRCLTVLFIGVMLYLKKHLDRVYQAIDRRIPRLQQPGQPDRLEQQPAAAAAPAGANNNNVPEDQHRELQQAPLAPLANDRTPSGSSEPTDSVKTERSETENATMQDGSSSSSSTNSRPIVPRPRTGPAAAGAATASQPAVLEEQQQLTSSSADADAGSVPAEQPAAEGQRMTLNDMTSFLGTLVITFFTSIIPDTPAA